MKRTIIVCAIAMSIFMTGCVDNALTTTTDADGNFIISSEGRESISSDNLPIKIKYNDAKIEFYDVDFYQEKTEHGYNPYAVISVDATNLSEDDVYWLEKNEDLSASIYVTSKDNGLDFESMSNACTYNDNETIKFVFWMQDEVQYGFEGSEFSAHVDVKQSETYEYENDKGEISDLNKENSCSYTKVLTSNDIKPTDSMDEELKNQISKALENIANTYIELIE